MSPGPPRAARPRPRRARSAVASAASAPRCPRRSSSGSPRSRRRRHQVGVADGHARPPAGSTPSCVGGDLREHGLDALARARCRRSDAHRGRRSSTVTPARLEAPPPLFSRNTPTPVPTARPSARAPRPPRAPVLEPAASSAASSRPREVADVDVDRVAEHGQRAVVRQSSARSRLRRRSSSAVDAELVRGRVEQALAREGALVAARAPR